MPNVFVVGCPSNLLLCRAFVSAPRKLFVRRCTLESRSAIRTYYVDNTAYIGERQAGSDSLKIVTACRVTRKRAHPLVHICETSFSETRGVYTTRMMASGRYRRGFCIDTWLGVCTLPVVEQIRLENKLRWYYLVHCTVAEMSS